MSLTTLVDNSRTDKNTSHSYLPVYEKLFEPYRHTAKGVLEIGIAQGGSIKLWRDYFYKAIIYGIDIYTTENMPSDLLSLPDVCCFTSTDAYSPEFINQIPHPLDIVIDDGPHTLVSQQQAILQYLPKLKSNGLLVIEDIQDYNHIDILHKTIPYTIPCTVEIHDLRQQKNRPDDILFIIKKL